VHELLWCGALQSSMTPPASLPVDDQRATEARDDERSAEIRADEHSGEARISSLVGCDERAERGLRISNADGCMYALMVGVSESYFGAMAVELGHRDTALALLLTVPMLFGALVQLLAGPFTALLGARKRLVVIGATLQMFSTLGLYWIAKLGVRSLLPLLTVESVYFACAFVVGPPWGSWMATLTAGRQRERYFARRGALVQVALLFAYVGAGFVLQAAGSSTEAKLRSFAALHLCAFGFRAISVCLLALQPDMAERARSVRQSVFAVRKAAQTADFRVAIYLAALMLGAHVAVPFFTPYMLRDLHLDYATYAALTAVAIVAKALFFPLLHPLSKRFGMRAVLGGCGAVVVMLPALWVVFDGIAGLSFVQVLSGMAWGGVEFAGYQLLLVSAEEDCSVEFLSLASTMSSSAQLVGGLSGGYLRSSVGLSYHALFVLSSASRALALLWMVRQLPARLRRDLPRMFLRVISARPAVGTVLRPIVSDTEITSPDDDRAA
jgi:MFS family permease